MNLGNCSGFLALDFSLYLESNVEINLKKKKKKPHIFFKFLQGKTTT